MSLLIFMTQISLKLVLIFDFRKVLFRICCKTHVVGITDSK